MVTGWVIRLAALAVIALHLVAGHLPEEAAWSVWPYTALPVGVAWLGAAVVASLALPPVNALVGRWVRRLWAALPGKNHPRIWFAAVAVATAIPFWLFRIGHLRWGDARFIVQALSYVGPDRPVWTLYNWQSPLTIFTHARLWLFLNPSPGIGVDTLYALSSVLSGVGFVYVLFLLADLLGRDALEKAVVFGLVITTGSIQLFFGYVENYTMMSLGLMLTLYLGVRYLRAGMSLVWPSLALAVTNAFHPSTLVLWPAVAYLAWYGTNTHPPGQPRASEWLKLVLPPILIFAGLSLLMVTGGHGPAAMLTDDRPGGADGIPFVPLFRVATEWQRYTMFSPAHLLDWANEHFLISPFGLFLLLLALIAFLVRRPSKKPDRDSLQSRPSPTEEQGITWFLSLASLAYLLLTFVWNPDYGGRQDWDLFAPSAFVYTTLAAYLLIRQLINHRLSPSGDRALGATAQLLIATSALHTGAWIYYNTIP